MRRFLFLALIFCSTLTAQDSIEEFVQNRYRLYPPTEEERAAVTQAIQVFFDKLRVHDLPDAYFNSTSVQFQKATSLKKFKVFVQSFEEGDFSTPDQLSVSFIDINKSKAFSTVLLKSTKDEQKFRLEISLEYQDEDWKIMSIKVFKVN